VLVVEDEMLVAMTIEDMLIGLGAEVVGPAMRLDAALELASTAAIDVAMLDVNLHGGRSYPVAELLAARGIPFVFATGYGHAEGADACAHAPMLTKPYREADLIRVLEEALTPD
jgi:CheY-like chemotaxis protein